MLNETEWATVTRTLRNDPHQPYVMVTVGNCKILMSPENADYAQSLDPATTAQAML